MQHNKIYVQFDLNKGRGVFAGTEFNRGDLIEICPVITIAQEDKDAIHKTGLHDYYFVWGDKNEQAAIALGYGSLYNHSSSPNAQFVNELDEQHIVIECLSAIDVGEEILINYVAQAKEEKIWFKEF